MAPLAKPDEREQEAEEAPVKISVSYCASKARNIRASCAPRGQEAQEGKVGHHRSQREE